MAPTLIIGRLYERKAEGGESRIYKLLDVKGDDIHIQNHRDSSDDFWDKQKILHDYTLIPDGGRGKKKSRNKSRKNKRKTMRRNKFMKWF